MSRHFERRISLAVTRRLAWTSITPNAMTLVSLAVGLSSAPFFLSARPAWQLLGALIFLTHSILDGCDGELARLKFLESPRGAMLDFWGDNVVHVAVFACMAGGLEPRHALGVAAAPGRGRHRRGGRGHRRALGHRAAAATPGLRGRRPASSTPWPTVTSSTSSSCSRRSDGPGGSWPSWPRARRSSSSPRSGPTAAGRRRRTSMAGFLDVLLRGLALCGQALVIGGVLFALIVLRPAARERPASLAAPAALAPAHRARGCGSGDSPGALAHDAGRPARGRARLAAPRDPLDELLRGEPREDRGVPRRHHRLLGSPPRRRAARMGAAPGPGRGARRRARL